MILFKRRTGLMAIALLTVAVPSALGQVGVEAGPGAQGFGYVGSLPRACSDARRDFDPGLGLVLSVSVPDNPAGCPSEDRDSVLLRAFSAASLAETRITLTSAKTMSNLADIAVDGVRHRLFVAYGVTNATVSGGLYRLATYDLTRVAARPVQLDPLQDVELPTAAPAYTAAAPDDPTGPPPTLIPGSAATGSAFLQTNHIQYDAPSNTLEVLAFSGGLSDIGGTSSHGPFSTNVYVLQLDGTAFQLQWAYRLPGCIDPLPLQTPANSTGPLIRFHGAAGDVVVAGCATLRAGAPKVPGSNVPFVSQLSGGSMETYLIPLKGNAPDGFDGTTSQGRGEAHIGRSHVLGGIAAPETGRVYFSAGPLPGNGAAAPGDTAVVFDVAHGVYVGAPAAGDALSAQTGVVLGDGGDRIYSVSPDGIVVISATATPPGQGTFHRFSICGVDDLLVTSRPRRLFVHCGDTNRVRVYQDDTPTLPTARATDPDGYTQQVPEQSGATISQYNGHAEATGTRARLIGGASGALDGVSFGGVGVAGGIASPGCQSIPAGSVGAVCPDDYSTHELDLAQISHGDLGNYQSTASASALSIDTNTAQDIQKTGSALPDTAVACSDPGSTAGANKAASDTAVTVTCNLDAHSTTVDSKAGPLVLSVPVIKALVDNLPPDVGQKVPALPDMPFTVGQSTAHTTSILDPTRGLVVTSQSAVHGLALGDTIRISSIEAQSQCISHGFHGTAACTFSRTLHGIYMPSSATTPAGPESCKEVVAPNVSDDTCATVLANLNSLVPGQLFFTMPNPDPRPAFEPGSPGGYQSVGQRELFRHLEDQTLNYDRSVEVPGLEVLYINDSINNPSRLDLQLASVESESHYGRTKLDLGSDPCSAAATSLTPTVTVAPPTQTVPVALAATGAGAHLVSARDVSSNSGCGGGTTDSGTRSPGTVGGFLPAPIPADRTPTPTPTILTVPGSVLERVWNGFNLLWRSPKDTMLAILLLAMLGGPVLLALRRRRLEDLAAGVGG
ncbi:MAG: hypothetical protein ACYDGR_07830 [Candidatus Dormibacteria bacterium]